MSFKKLYILCNISLLLAAMISGLSFVAQKAGMDYVGPFTFNVMRSLIGSLSLLPVIFLQDKICVIEQNYRFISSFYTLPVWHDVQFRCCLCVIADRQANFLRYDRCEPINPSQQLTSFFIAYFIH